MRTAAAEAGCAHTLLGGRSKVSQWGTAHTLLPAGASLSDCLCLSAFFFFFLFKPLQTILKKPQPSQSNYPRAAQKIITIQPAAHARMQTLY